MKACLVCVPARCGCVGLDPRSDPRVSPEQGFSLFWRCPSSCPRCPCAPVPRWSTGGGSGHLPCWTPRDSQMPSALHTSYFVATLWLKPPRVNVSLSLPCAVSVGSVSGHTFFLLAWWWCQASSLLSCACFPSTKCPSVWRKRDVFLPWRKVSILELWVPREPQVRAGLWLLTCTVQQSSLSGSAPPRQAFAENSYSPGSRAL